MWFKVLGKVLRRSKPAHGLASNATRPQVKASPPPWAQTDGRVRGQYLVVVLPLSPKLSFRVRCCSSSHLLSTGHPTARGGIDKYHVGYPAPEILFARAPCVNAVANSLKKTGGRPRLPGADRPPGHFRKPNLPHSTPLRGGSRQLWIEALGTFKPPE